MTQAATPTTEHELDIWRNWPDAGVGIVCGSVVAVDIDIAAPELARRPPPKGE